MYDVVIIGAGVCGSLIARRLSFSGLHILVLEKGYDLANGSSRANSAVVHAGFDPVPGTLKAKLNVRGAAMMEQTCRELGVPYKKTPSLVVAFSDEEMKTVNALYERGVTNGVGNMRILGKKELHDTETALSDEAVGALYADSALVCPYKLTIAAAENAAVNGAEFRFGYEVEKITFSDGVFTVNDDITAKCIINCAGVGSAKVASLIGDDSFRIFPRRGEYMLYDKTSLCVKSVIFTVPTEKGKGVLVLPTESGNMLVGPNAEHVSDGTETQTTPEGLSFVLENAKKIVPALNTRGVITQFAGIRATPSGDDFIIAPSEKNGMFINCAGIESPGLASSPAIAEYTCSIVGKLFDVSERGDCVRTRKAFPVFAECDDGERARLVSENPLFGHVVCRCETITEAEIVDSIHRPLGARTIDGVKLRTRSGMGRCQGGFCSPKVAKILSRELGIPLTEITKKGGSSYLLTGKTK